MSHVSGGTVQGYVLRSWRNSARTPDYSLRRCYSQVSNIFCYYSSSVTRDPDPDSIRSVYPDLGVQKLPAKIEKV
jgi:hypothetical protein